MFVHEFKDEADFKRACRRARQAGLPVEIFTPVPDEELAELMGVNTRPLGVLTILGGGSGLLLAALITYVPSVVTFPINIGGRPLNSWPVFVIIAFELAILFAAFALVGGLVWMNHWPSYDREIFQLEQFNRKRNDHYFILSEEELKDARTFATYRLDGPR